MAIFLQIEEKILKNPKFNNQAAFLDYLKLLKYYKILNDQQNKDLKNISESIKSKLSSDQARTLKIEKFKAMKEFKNLVEVKY